MISDSDPYPRRLSNAERTGTHGWETAYAGLNMQVKCGMWRFLAVLVSLLTAFGLLVPATAHADEESLV